MTARVWIFCALLISAAILSAGSDDEPPEIGNFSLPASQQVGPFYSFGDLIIDKGQVQFLFYVQDLRGKNSSYIDIYPTLIYGATDNTTLSFAVPVASYKEENSASSGFEDLYFQVEYAFYTASTKTYADQATVVASVSVPTGSADEDPMTGFGNPGYFLGMTLNRMTVDWFAFMNYGALFNPTFKSLDIGDQYYYQYGLSRVISTWKGWLFAWLLELDGTYTKQNRINGVLDPDSGGNEVLLIPSLWISSEKIIIQFGAGYPIYQNLNGNQPTSRYLIAADFLWTF